MEKLDAPILIKEVYASSRKAAGLASLTIRSIFLTGISFQLNFVASYLRRLSKLSLVSGSRSSGEMMHDG